MRNKIIFAMVGVGILAGLVSAYVYARPAKPQPPAFNPASNPYSDGIYANGIVESYQANGENVNFYPEVSGTVAKIPVAEGQSVKTGDALVVIDDTIQRALAEQQNSQADAALALYNELKAQPRKETLDVARAQVEMAIASLKNASDQLEKQAHAYKIDPRSVSKDVLDNADNAFKVAKSNLDVVTRQYQLTKAGAWSYDIENQKLQHEALLKASVASSALVGKYTLRAPSDGVVLSIHTSIGSYVSPLGAFDPYTDSMGPVVVMGSEREHLAVRAYIDEILITRLPSKTQMHATMFIRGTNVKVPLTFERIQPHVSPKIQLSNERTEKVDLRVLPIIFKFEPPAGMQIYPGELVDVYVGDK